MDLINQNFNMNTPSVMRRKRQPHTQTSHVNTNYCVSTQDIWAFCSSKPYIKVKYAGLVIKSGNQKDMSYDEIEIMFKIYSQV